MAFLFNNPLLYELRGGNADSPFIDKQNSRLIVNNVIILDEIPDEFTGTTIVLTGTAQAGGATTITLTASASSSNDRYKNFTISITGGTGSGQSKTITGYVGSTKVATVSAWSVNPDNTSVYSIACYTESKTNISLSLNSFYVNYLNGIVTFNSSENGQTVLVLFKGRGIIQIPAERIYYTDENNNVAGNFQDLAVAINSVVPAENSRIIAEMTRANSEATRMANEVIRVSAESSRVSVETARVSNENARITNESSRQTAENNRVSDFQSMVDSSKMILQNPVATYADIATTYPTPLIYWVVRTINDGKLYRYNGVAWVWIDTLITTVYDTLVQALNSNNSVTTDTQMIFSMGGMI
jgi:hypothetical protein